MCYCAHRARRIFKELGTCAITRYARRNNSLRKENYAPAKNET